MSTSTVKYLAVPSERMDRTEGAQAVPVGFDLIAITDHDAQGESVFLYGVRVGWSRTIEGIRTLVAQRDKGAQYAMRT